MASDPLAPLLQLPGVEAAVAQTRTMVDRLLGHRVLRHDSGRVSSESALRGAWASADLAGHSHPLTDVRAGSVTDPVVNGALRATAEVGQLVEMWQVAPRQALARLHLVAARDLADESDLGRPRLDRAQATRLDQLAELLAPTGRGTDVPAVILAAVVHGELLALQPFPQANGVVARAAERLTLVARGLDPKSLTVPEVGHRDASDYLPAAQGFATGTPDGVATWLVHCCRAVELGAREGLAVCESIQRG